MEPGPATVAGADRRAERGVQAPRASWGALIDQGTDYIERWPHLVIPPMIALAVALIGFTLLGDAIRDALDPRVRRRR